MTKLEILRKYMSENRKDKVYTTWYVMGSNVANQTTSFFGEGMLYKVDLQNSDFTLNNALIYCKQEHIGTCDWKTAIISDTTLGYISFGNDVVTPNFVYLFTIPDVGMMPIEGFVPFQEEKSDTDLVQISDSDYATCMSVIGYPFITDEELEYSSSQIINLAIKPALQEYFKWLPKVEITTTQIGTSKVVEVPFPIGAYDIVHFSIQQRGNSIGTGATLHTLWRSFEEGMYGAYNLSGITGSYFGNTAPSTKMSSSSNYLTSRAATQGLINYSTRSHIDKYIDNTGQKWARLYSTKGGVAEIHWAMETLNFDDVEFAQRNNLIEYCQCNIKLLFARLREQANSEVSGHFDYSKWTSEAVTRKTEIVTEWKSLVKMSSLIRGSL